MWKFLTCSVLSFILLVSLAFTGKKHSHETTSNSLLWKIEGNGLKQASYLFGTMHLIQKDYFYFPGALEKIVKNSGLLITEINLNELDDQAEAMKLLTLPEGNMTDFFTPSQKDSLLRWVKNRLMMDEPTFLTTFGKFKPILIIQLATQMAFFGKTESYELTLKNLAHKHRVELAGLESMKEQFSFFDSMSREDQAEMVMETIRDEHKAIGELELLQRVYSKQNLDSIEIIIQQDHSVVTKNENILLKDRNHAWIPKIETHIQKKNCFIAVGAAHLVGPDGLIQLLRAKGYQLTAINI